MGEFVGLEPGGARALCTTMGTVLSQVSTIKAALAEGIGQAGTDYPAAAGGAEALNRSGSFLTDAQRDLKWRIQTITSVPGNTVGAGGFRSATFVFDTPDQARNAGAEAGKKLKEAYDAYDRARDADTRDKLMEALKAANATGDPEYAAGFLNGLTPAAAHGVFSLVLDSDKNPQGVGLTPEDLERFKTDLGPLIQAFTTADAAGLAPSLHKLLVESGGPDLLTALLAAAPQSRQFLLDTGQYLLSATTSVPGGDNWRLHWFLQALTADPEALQQLLAKDPKNAELLLQPAVSGDHASPGVHALLVKALQSAIAPGTGTDAQRRAAFFNVARVYGGEAGWHTLSRDPELKQVFVTALERELNDPEKGKAAFQEIADIFAHGGKPPAILNDDQVNHIFTEHLGKYLPELSRLQAWRHDPALATLNPGGDWGRLDEKELGNLFAGVFQRKEGRDAVVAAFTTYLGTLDVGGGNLNDPSDREKFTLAMAEAAGIGGLMVSGVHALDMSAEDKRKLAVQLALMPVDFTIGKIVEPVPGEIHGLGMSKLEDLITKDLDKDDGGWLSGLPVIGGLFNHGNDNGEASDLAKSLAQEQIDHFKQRLADAGKPPLSQADEVMLLNAVQGLYFEPIIDALKDRGG
ncbi:hypothetical protein [Microbispora sp. NPDC049125]|uniref:hypothetical protein n=1 Tax=Microbispora sp. NPDC049125 TaxID=3154929 RepID=UPI0034657073